MTSSRFTSSNLASIGLWLMLIVLPALAGKLIFSAAIDLEKQLENSRIRQKLSIELQKYSTALSPKTWLRDKLSAESSDQLISRIFKGKAGLKEYRAHPFYKEMPDFSNPEAGLASFSNLFYRFTGAFPDILMVMAPEKDGCAWLIRKPFLQPLHDESMRSNLVSAGNKIGRRLAWSSSTLPDSLKMLADESEIRRATGFFDFLSTNFNIAKEHFSTHTNSMTFVSLFPLPDAGGHLGKRFILVMVSTASLSPRFMLKTTCRDFSSKLLQHSFGHTSNQMLPAYIEEEGRVALIGETPESFSKLAFKHIQAGNKPLAIKISDRRNQSDYSRKARTADTILLLYALAASLIFAGIQTGRIRTMQSIQRLVAAGLFAGILLPLSGTTWLGICYLNTRRHLEAENTLNWMQNIIFQKDQAIQLQMARNILFRNLFSGIMASMPLTKLEKINDITGFYEPEGVTQGRQSSDTLSNLIETYSIYHPDLEDIIGSNTSRKKITETPHLFFGSHARETLYHLGAMDHLPSGRIKQMLDRTEYMMGFLDNVLDTRIVSKVFAEEKAGITNVMSTRREQLTASFWKSPQNTIPGLSIMQTTSSCWFYNLAQMIKAGMFQQEYWLNGYRIKMNIYLRDSYNHRSLDDQSLKVRSADRVAAAADWSLAEALFSFADTARINNLDAPSPNLICAGPAVNGDVWIMGIAEPEGENTVLSWDSAMIMLSLLAVLCSLVLARGLSRVLLRPVPAFESAVNELSGQRFNFSLQIRNGDEFDILGESFNQVTRKLHEKEKLSQLVSRNVLDAISSADGEYLKPEGTRVRASILFADLRGFTSISENHPPEEIVAMLNDYFSLMADIIERNGGMIDKLIGDAIQAVFYARENANCAESAVRAGLEMRAALPAFNNERRQQGRFTIDNGVGICTGEVICGRVGSEHGMLDVTVIGSLVNRAAHLESLSRHGLGSKVLVDETTGSAIAGTYQCRHLADIDAGVEVV